MCERKTIQNKYFPISLYYICLTLKEGFSGGLVVKNLPPNAGDVGLIPGSGRFRGEGNGNPLQYSCWEIPWTEEPVGYSSWGCRNQTEASEHSTWFAYLPGIPHVCLALSDKFNITYIHLELQSWQIPCHTCEDWRSGKLSHPLDLGSDTDQSDRWVQSHT